jgi:hypothetical protein
MCAKSAVPLCFFTVPLRRYWHSLQWPGASPDLQFPFVFEVFANFFRTALSLLKELQTVPWGSQKEERFYGKSFRH